MEPRNIKRDFLRERNMGSISQITQKLFNFIGMFAITLS
jgi:hypothetical protein